MNGRALLVAIIVSGLCSNLADSFKLSQPSEPNSVPLPDFNSTGTLLSENNPENEHPFRADDEIEASQEDDLDGEDDSEEDSSAFESLDLGSSRDRFVDEKLNTLLKSGVEQASASVIESVFNNKKTFSCPRIKTDLKTGTSIGDLSPEDIGIIAAMGDALSTGIGLWPRTEIEFRGAAFPSGGDATIDGLVTIPNILREFNQHLLGVSHGMGTREQLPEHQLNVAASGAFSGDLPEQARLLVSRLVQLREVNYAEHWVMVIIAIGTEEVCNRCSGPDLFAIQEAIAILQRGLPKAFVVLLGPLHVADSNIQNENWLSKRCECLTTSRIERITQNWTTVFETVQMTVDNDIYRSPTFGVLALPQLTITSRFPNGLFLPRQALLNRRGHMYATKWLWNRLVAGSKYNLSTAILSQDTYFCPSTGCPYFRTTANMHGCQLLSLSEASEKELTLGADGKVVKTPRRSKERLYTIALVIVGTAFFVVFTLSTVFYQKSKQGDRGRFEVVEESQIKFEEVKKEEERALLSRQNTRALSVDPLIRSVSMSARRLNSECENITIPE